MKPSEISIKQITAVVENTGTWQRVPNLEATVFGLSSADKVYYWGVINKTFVVTKPTEENDFSKGHYVKEYGWREYQP